jgi:hypothetical protein
MTTTERALSQLAPPERFEDDWDDVLRRAGEQSQAPTRRGPFWILRRRRFVLAFAVAVAILVPLAAIASANEWWFLKDGGLPQPTGAAPAVVKTGVWSGHSWQLVAYRSGDNLCFSVDPRPEATAADNGAGAAAACAPFAGVANSPASPTEMSITYMSGSSHDFLSYIAGPVIERATEVAVTFTDGRVLRLPTFAAPTSLGAVRFYASQLSDPATAPSASPPSTSISKLTGYDNNNVVACLVLATAVDGVSPLSDCR